MFTPSLCYGSCKSDVSLDILNTLVTTTFKRHVAKIDKIQIDNSVFQERNIVCET